MESHGAYDIIIQASKPLLTQKKSGPYKGLWDLPGTAIEYGESPETTLKREIEEEAAVIVPDAPPDANRQDLFILATHPKERYEKDYSNGITKMCTHIDGNIPYTGVPGDVSQRKAWYAVLNNYLKLISVKLPKHSEDVQRDVFVQLNYVSGECGGAWMDEARTQYLRLVGEADVLVNLKGPAVKAFTILADFKKRAMAQLNFHYVEKNGYEQRHVNIFLDKHLGPLLGVAGEETQVEDVYAPGELEKRALFEDLGTFLLLHAIGALAPKT